MLIDTHAHLFFEDYEGKVDEVIERARAAGVGKIIVPGTDLETSKKAVELAQKYRGVVYAAAGIHPEEVGVDNKSQVAEVRKLIQENKEQVVAVGEVGIDLNTDALRANRQEQIELFGEQCKLAARYELPVIVHTRQSVAEVIAVMDEVRVRRAQLHCFSGTEEELRQVLDRGYFVSFCGNVSWSKRVRAMSALVPTERLLLETDSPFMTPRNGKGEPFTALNEPSNVTILAQIIARERGVSEGQLAEQTTKNVKELFQI